MTRREVLPYVLVLIGLAFAGYASRRRGPRLTRKALDVAGKQTPQEIRENNR